MKRNGKIMLQSIIAFGIVILLSCSSTTLIKSTPSGANVYINGELTGTTPYLHTDNRISFMGFNVDISKDGYEPIYTYISRSDEFNTGHFIGGLIFPPILLWSFDYRQSYNFELIPIDLSTENNNSSATNNNIVVPLRTKADRLKELKQLYDEKLISEKDYETKKQKILDEE